jgi:hypothetical protein
MISWLDAVSVALLAVAVVMTGMGGLMDIFGVRLTPSREHYWNDATFLVLFVIALQLIYRRR